MAFSFDFFADAGLTTPVGTLTIAQEADGSTGPVDNSVFLGSPQAGRKVEATSQPGVDQISLSVTDTTPGAGHESTEIKLSLTAAGLDTAVAGASIDIAPTITSEAANAVEVFVRVEDATGQVGVSSELGLQTNEVVETAV